MIRRLTELTLIVIIAVGGFQAWKTGLERNRLQADFDRLILATGDLPIGDLTRVHLRAIPTGEPLHYAWRVYLPANYLLQYQTSAGMGGKNQSSAEPRNFIARVRLHELDGQMFLFQKFDGGGGSCNLGDPSIAAFLKGREAKVVAEQLGSEGVATFGPGDSVQLLRLTLPEEIQDDARKLLSPYEKTAKIPVLLTVDLGPKKPKPASAPGAR